jgi:hypothetical protein
MFFLSSILQSYISAKTLRQGKMIFHGLDEEEVKVINDNLISTRLKELKKWVKKGTVGKDISRSVLLLEMMNADVKQISTFILQ